MAGSAVREQRSGTPREKQRGQKTLLSGVLAEALPPRWVPPRSPPGPPLRAPHTWCRGWWRPRAPASTPSCFGRSSAEGPRAGGGAPWRRGGWLPAAQSLLRACSLGRTGSPWPWQGHRSCDPGPALHTGRPRRHGRSAARGRERQVKVRWLSRSDGVPAPAAGRSSHDLASHAGRHRQL